MKLGAEHMTRVSSLLQTERSAAASRRRMYRCLEPER